MLTDAAVRKAVPRDKAYKLADGAGLYLYVMPKGGRSWRYKYRYGGKERRLVFGTYPTVGLSARGRCGTRRARPLPPDAIRRSKRARHARTVAHEDTFERFATAWHDLQKARWRPVHAKDVIESMRRNQFPVIGAYRVAEIDEA